MARPTEDKPWHAGALQMKREGASFSQIAAALGVNISTVKAFVIRSSKNPERQLDAVIKDRRPKVAPVTLPESDQQSLVEIIMVVERRRARTMLGAMDDIDEFRKWSSDKVRKDPDGFKLAVMKMQSGIETMKALKGGAGTIDIDIARLPAGGGVPDDVEKLQFEIVDPAPRELETVEGS